MQSAMRTNERLSVVAGGYYHSSINLLEFYDPGLQSAVFYKDRLNQGGFFVVTNLYVRNSKKLSNMKFH